MSKRKKECSVRDGKFVEPCDHLQSVLEYSTARKGVVGWQLMDMTGPMTPSRFFVGCKSGEHTKKGVVFNFCPFCGTAIDAPIKAKDEDAA